MLEGQFMAIEFSAAIPTFIITLREGVEAALVVGIVLAYLHKAGQAKLSSWVYAGIVGGILASVLVGVGFVGVIQVLAVSDQPYATVMKPALEGLFGVIAIGLLSWMLIWMTQQAKSLKTQVEQEIGTALASQVGAGWGIFGLIFVAVLREGFETVVFIAAQFQQGWIPAIGAVAGLTGAVGIGILLFRLGVKINLRRFFQIMGIFLLLIVAGLVVSALAHFDVALTRLIKLDPQYADLCLSSRPLAPSQSCILGSLLWDSSRLLPARQFPGIILHTLFGYTDHLYWVEAIAYVTFLLTVGGSYLQSVAGWSWLSSRKQDELPSSQPSP